MNKGVKFSAIILVAILLCAGLSIASFEYKGNGIERIYSAGEKIRGLLNISFSDEPADAILRSNFKGTIKLLDLLEKNGFSEGVDYICSNPGCLDIYKTAGSATTVALSEDSPLIVGFNVVGEDIVIQSLRFDMSSNAGASCNRQLLIDVLDRNEYFIQSNKNSGAICGEEYEGCFSAAAPTSFADITTNPYCENISLTPAPSYQLMGIVKKGTSDTNLEMTLHNSDWAVLGECMLPKQTQDTDALGCIVNYTVTSAGNYFVCISADSDNSEYKIRSEETNPICGTSTSGTSFDTDFELFAHPIKFDALGTLSVNESTFYDLNGETDFVGEVQSYIDEQGNCSKGCIVPFKITGLSQSLTFSNANLKFTKYNRGKVENVDGLQKLEKQKSGITTTKPLNIELGNAGITIPLSASNTSKLYLYLNERPILPAPLNLTIKPSFGFDIYPKIVLFGVKTDFQVISPYTITSSSWNFGDGVSRTALGNAISHRYTQFETGYNVDVELTRSDGAKARNSFSITTGSLSESASKLMQEYENVIGNITNIINTFSSFIAEGLRSKLNLNEMKTSLNNTKQGLNNATSDEGYLSAINAALAINIPASIVVSEEGSAPISAGFENINVQILEQISGTTLSESGRADIKKAIAAWVEKNYDASVTYKVISKTNDNNEKEPILTDVKISLTKKPNADASSNTAYLIIDYPKDSITFAGNYSEMVSGSGTYMLISDSGTIEFLIYSKVSPSSLGMYISPKISELGTYGQIEIIKAGGFNWGRFIFWITVLLVIAFIAYIALQEWYKRRYESYLFKNPNDLYNIINFIFNSRKNGTDDTEIAKKLKIVGWKGEQITYAFKKLDGKRTGMFEIPIFRIFEKRKIEQEIEKRKSSQAQTPSQTEQKQQPQQQSKPLLK